MSGEYRKVTMDIDSLWKLYSKDFTEVEIGFLREDEKSGLELIYPKQFYKLANGRVLRPDYFRDDYANLLKTAFCREYESFVVGRFTYVCGVYQEVDGHKQFVFSFDTEKDPERYLSHILIKYEWNKCSSIEAKPLPEALTSESKVLYEKAYESGDGYDGVQYFVVSAADFWYKAVIANYYGNLGQLINKANVNLDTFDRWKNIWRKAFEQVGRPAVESLGGNTVEMVDDEMIATYTDARENKIINHYWYDRTGWQNLLADRDYGPCVPKEALTEDGLPLCIVDELCA